MSTQGISIGPFFRGLNEKALDILKEFLAGGIGKDLLAREENGAPCFCLFFRDNYVDFYHRGCRALSFHPLARENVFQIDRKYTRTEGNKSPVSLESVNGDLVFKGWSFRENVLRNPYNTFSPWIKGTSESTRGEKDCLHEYFMASRKETILDVEIAFTVLTKGARPSALRMDFASVPIGGNQILFTEAKRDTDSRLRSRKGEPKVLTQMEIYRQFLQGEKDRITSSYRQVIDNILRLNLEQRFAGSRNAKSVLERLRDNLSIAPEPQLLVFQTKPWTPDDEDHWRTLEDTLKQRGFPLPQKMVVLALGIAPNTLRNRALAWVRS